MNDPVPHVRRRPSRPPGPIAPSRNARLLLATVATAIVAVTVALVYLSGAPGRMHVATVLATIFGVGGTILIAGALMTLIYHSDRSGHDDRAGR